ncbi:HAMP domain-containing sensor histidine kinase [Paenibacillus filicis]|uniref:histidine kinase n=1 Tax=Paenibacillus gyeongsangnamensis TaxID=3388067 RepID=A0ABT4Q608_9BACL|nr:HAMP domain-containing sensor histidine kinase [Paenibacillus filicis]MCZ8512227.1 HAMP domain-containing sensor histidine kinase [Paenibacillus filicis]
MSIRRKLLLSYAAMLVVPLVLIMLISALLAVVFRGDLQNIRNDYKSQVYPLDDHRIDRLSKEIKRTAQTNPALLGDTGYLDDVSHELELSGSGLVIRKDGADTYASASVNAAELLEALPSFERGSYKEQDHTFRYKQQLYSVDPIFFTYPDKHPGTILVVNKINPFADFALKFFPMLFISMIVVLVLTHTVLTYLMSKSIIRPLLLLKRAVTRIKTGDLDSSVQVTGKDEIGQLGFAFEEMRKQLQEYEHNRKELISNISHDLKTPLTAIRGYVDGIEDGIADTPEKIGKYIRTISSKAEEMDHLIDELFLYSKLDLKRLPFQFETVPFRAFLQDWAEELQFDLEKRGIGFHLDIQSQQTTQVAIDRDKLKRVFSNIVDNCVKYMDKAEPVIRLKGYETANSVIVELADNGQGIDADAVPHIFERFYRAEQSRNTHTGGSGLGLAIAKQIMDGHGGAIQAQSVKGVGTRIAISLPIKYN